VSAGDTHRALDDAVRDHLQPHLRPDGEVIVAWLVVAATRAADGGGVVIDEVSDDAIPGWQVRGMVAEWQAGMDRRSDNEES
jgi:hypothetical protein